MEPPRVLDALAFFNRVAVRYLVEITKRIWSTCDDGMVCTPVWLAEACKVWTVVWLQDVLNDDRYALAHLCLEIYLEMIF